MNGTFMRIVSNKETMGYLQDITGNPNLLMESAGLPASLVDLACS